MKDNNEFLREKPQDVKDEQARSLLFKIITLAAIFLGIWASTQEFCRTVGYEPGWCGRPFYMLKLGDIQYPLYQPFMIFYWVLLYYQRTEIHPFLYAAMKITGIVSAAAIVFYFVMDFFLVKRGGQKFFGTARWAARKDLKKVGLLEGKGGVILGQLPEARVSARFDPQKQTTSLHLQKPAQKIIQAGINNIALSAPTRSGKGVSCVIPTCLSYPGSMIILDFKAENFNMTSGFRAKFGKVYRWAPTGETGHHFNPMMEIRPGKDAYADANLLADILTTPASGGGNANSEHFQTAAKELLTSAILHCLTCPLWQDKSLPGVQKFLASIDETEPENANYVCDLMLKADHGDPVIHEKVCLGAGNQRKRADREAASVNSTAANALAVFADIRIAENSSNSEFYINEFQETKVPVTLYVTIQYSDIERIAPLIRMFIILFSRRFTSGETQATNRKFKIPVLFLLDEFDKLGKMDELQRNMGIHNGYGIHYFLIFQSIDQITALYGQNATVLAHCQNSVFYAPNANEYKSAEIISKMCGVESISRANVSYSGNRGQVAYSNRSLSEQDQQRNLINPDEVMKLPADQAILMSNGIPPAIIKKNVYYEDPVFKNRLIKKPAFGTREEALKIAAGTIAKLNGPQWFDSSRRIHTQTPIEKVSDRIDNSNTTPDDFTDLNGGITNPLHHHKDS
jgi:type IV secretion system protein VirD4